MRLRRAGDFARAYRSGSRARCAYLTLVAAPNGLPCTRLGLSVGKRFHRRAVVRNRLRRLVREAFRLEYSQLPKGYDLIAVGSEPGVEPSLRALRAEFVRCAARAARRSGERQLPPKAADPEEHQP